MTISVIIKRTSRDYEGYNDEIIGLYDDYTKARKICNKLNKEEGSNFGINCVEFFIDNYTLNETTN